MGGYITGSAAIIDCVRSFAPGLHLHHLAAARDRGGRALASVRHLKTSDAEREVLA